MIRGKRVLAVIPARGGSKGIPLKNLRPVGGVPLVARIGPILDAVTEIDRRVVSTDHDEIARVAEAAGIAADFRRPPELSGDRVGDLPVLVHALEATEAIDRTRYDIVMMIQPTSPMRRPEHLRQTLSRMVEEDLDSVWTVSEIDRNYHPLKQLVVGDDGALDYYDPRGAEVIARQDLTPVYHRNGAAYAFTRACLMEYRSILGARAAAVITEPLVDVDKPEDLDLLEYYLSHGR